MGSKICKVSRKTSELNGETPSSGTGANVTGLRTKTGDGNGSEKDLAISPEGAHQRKVRNRITSKSMSSSSETFEILDENANKLHESVRRLAGSRIEILRRRNTRVRIASLKMKTAGSDKDLAESQEDSHQRNVSKRISSKFMSSSSEATEILDENANKLLESRRMLAKLRSEILRGRNNREIASQKMKTAGATGKPVLSHSSRLAEGMEQEFNLERVNDLEGIINLRHRLEEKYIASLLPKVMWLHSEIRGIYSDEMRKDWLKTLATLRLVSKVTKTAVDTLITQGSSFTSHEDKFKCLSVDKPDYFMKQQVPVLRVGASEKLYLRLKEALNQVWTYSENRSELLAANFPLKALVLDDSDWGTGDVGDVHCHFGWMLNDLGRHFTSFHYITQQKSLPTYEHVAYWVGHMPNLTDLRVELRGPVTLADSMEETGRIKLRKFPKCPNLKRYSEGNGGFGVPYLKQILESNPSIQEVHLGETPPMEWRNLKKVLDSLQLQITTFYTSCVPTDPLFYKVPCQWAVHIRTMVLWNPEDQWGQWEIPSEYLFKLLSSMENLMSLRVSMPCLRDSGKGCPCPSFQKLEYLMWKVFPTFKTLAFLKSAKKLQYLALDVSNCWDLRDVKAVQEFYGEWGIPAILPELKAIRVRIPRGGYFMRIWKLEDQSA